jgi:aminoglycoside phosphotransferase (APT) family kinase protein
MEYSKRLGNISDNQLQEALNKFELGKLLKAEPIPFGLFGQNFFLTSTKGEFVLRGCPHYPWQFKSEQFVCDLLHKHTKTPVPWPYLLDENTDIFGWSYIIMPKMKGLQLEDQDVSKNISIADRVEIAKAIGRNLAEMQNLKWEFCGKYDGNLNSIKSFGCDYDEWVSSWIKDLLAKAENLNNSDIQWVKKIIDKGREALREKFIPCFVLQDYREGNLVVSKIENKWEVTGVFDLMEFYFGDGEADLSRSFIMYKERNEDIAYAFINSYLAVNSVRPGFFERFAIYIIRDRLIIWEYANRSYNKVWWDKKLSFCDWSEKYTVLNSKKLKNS